VGSQLPTRHILSGLCGEIKLRLQRNQMSNMTESAQQATIVGSPAVAVADATITEFLNTVGKPRLDPYRTFFGCSSERELLGAYLWGQAIASAFTPLVSTVEIVLRNAIHREASLFSSQGASASHPWYDFTRTDAFRVQGKSREKIAALLYDQPYSASPTRKAVQPAADQVVASLSFGFWPAFLEGISKAQRPRLLTNIFVGHPHSTPKHWSHQPNVDRLIATLKKVRDLRNHISHYEPVWKPHRLTGREPNWTHSVGSLKNLHAEVLDMLGWCCQSAPQIYKAIHGARYFKRLCSTNAVRVFMADPFATVQIEALPVVAPAVVQAK